MHIHRQEAVTTVWGRGGYWGECWVLPWGEYWREYWGEYWADILKKGTGGGYKVPWRNTEGFFMVSPAFG